MRKRHSYLLSLQVFIFRFNRDERILAFNYSRNDLKRYNKNKYPKNHVPLLAYPMKKLKKSITIYCIT